MKIMHICLGGGWYQKNAYQDQLLPLYHRRLGHDVTVVASYYGRWNIEKGNYDLDKVPETILDDGTKLLRISPLFTQKINAHIHLFKGLKPLFEREQPDLIFLHSVVCLNYLSVVSYKKKHPNVKIVCDNHADKNNSHRHWTTKLWSKIIIKYILIKKLVPVVEWFYGVTPIRCNFLISEYGVPKSKVKLLVLGADDKNMHFESRNAVRQQLRGRLKISKDDFLVVTGGRINKNKYRPFLSLVKGIESLNISSLKLLLFGPISDDIKAQFDKYHSDRLLIVGEIPSDRVYDYFYSADIVAFPGLHSVMWEQAVASKVPCIFHQVRGFEHVDFGGNCLWVEEDNAQKYELLFRELLGNRSKYDLLLERANSDEANMFLYSRIAKQVLDDVFVSREDYNASK